MGLGWETAGGRAVRATIALLQERSSTGHGCVQDPPVSSPRKRRRAVVEGPTRTTSATPSRVKSACRAAKAPVSDTTARCTSRVAGTGSAGTCSTAAAHTTIVSQCMSRRAREGDLFRCVTHHQWATTPGGAVRARHILKFLLISSSDGWRSVLCRGGCGLLPRLRAAASRSRTRQRTAATTARQIAAAVCLAWCAALNPPPPGSAVTNHLQVAAVLVANSVHQIREGHVGVYYRAGSPPATAASTSHCSSTFADPLPHHPDGRMQGGALLNKVGEPGFHIGDPITTMREIQVDPGARPDLLEQTTALHFFFSPPALLPDHAANRHAGECAVRDVGRRDADVFKGRGGQLS